MNLHLKSVIFLHGPNFMVESGSGTTGKVGPEHWTCVYSTCTWNTCVSTGMAACWSRDMRRMQSATFGPIPDSCSRLAYRHKDKN
jgi:hypothetical protein